MKAMAGFKFMAFRTSDNFTKCTTLLDIKAVQENIMLLWISFFFSQEKYFCAQYRGASNSSLTGLVIEKMYERLYIAVGCTY